MNTFKRFIQLVRSFSSPHPLRDWFAVLVVAALALVAFVGTSTYYFFGLRSGSIIGTGVAEVTRVPRVSREELEAVVTLFETRTLNFDADNFRIPDVSDPSR